MKAGTRATSSARHTTHLVFAVCVVFGFAFFKTAQSMAYATAMSSSGSPFIMLSNLAFTVVASIPIVLADCVVIVLAFKGWLPSFRLPIFVPTLLLAAGSMLSFFGGLDGMPPFAHLVVVCLFYGVGSALITLVWVELFSSIDVVKSMQLLASAMLLSALLSTALMQLSTMVSTVCIAVFALAGVVLYVKAKHVVLAADAVDICVSFPLSSVKRYTKGLLSISNGLAVLLALSCVVGILNSFMLVGGYAFEGSDVAGNLGVILGYSAFFIVAYTVPKHLGIELSYRILFPILATLLFAWPFLGSRFGFLFSVLFITGYEFSSIGVMYLIIRESHDHALNPYVFMGVSVLMIRLSVLVGLLVGGEIASRSYDWASKAILIVAIAMYVLAFVLLYLSRGRKAARAERKREPAPLELSDDEEFKYKAEELGKQYGLTEREQEILAHLARGRSSTYIGELLWLSPNTVRGHIKKIYMKLAVHSKQELIDLFLDESISGGEVHRIA